MPKTTLILVTVLFGVICGNRLMDNRLLRSAAITSYETAPYRSISDVKMHSNNGEINDDLKLKSRDKPPCGSSIDIASDLKARNCNENLKTLLKQIPPNYMVYDTSAVGDNKVNDLNVPKSYQTIRDFEDDDNAFDVEDPIESAIKSIPKLNMFPVATYKDFYQDLVVETAKQELTKRNGNSLPSALGSPPPRGCDCKIRNELVDLGQQHFPRYLLNAICHSEHSRTDVGPRCWSGSACRPLEYKVKVLTFRTLMDNLQQDPTLAWLPDDLRQIWKFKTVTVTAGCFCS